MIDIDHFKAVNDTYGHQAGDAALAAAAEMRDSLRGYDVPGRFGGEEFAVLLPGTTGEEACLIAQRLRERLAAATTLVGESTPVQITVSVGVTALSSASADLDELISAADIALYRDVGRHSSWRRNDTDFEQDQNRNSHVSGDTSVNIAASRSGV